MLRYHQTCWDTLTFKASLTVNKYSLSLCKWLLTSHRFQQKPNSNGLARIRCIQGALCQLRSVRSFESDTVVGQRSRTNRFYFSFLNEVQFRTLQDGIKRRGEQERFGFNVGTRLYRKILEGDTVGPRIIQGDTYDPKAPVNMSSPLSGLWPPLQPPLPKGALVSDLSEGSQRLMDYLRREGYCKADRCKLQSVETIQPFRMKRDLCFDFFLT